jgi:hypothetical protein
MLEVIIINPDTVLNYYHPNERWRSCLCGANPSIATGVAVAENRGQFSDDP